MQEERKNLLDTAVALYEKGLSVIPVTQDKKPLVKFKDIRPDFKTVTNIIRASRDCMIAVKTEDFFVIDVDTDKGTSHANGFEEFNKIPTELLPATLSQTTASGGKQYFYLKRNDIQLNKMLNIGAGIDIKAQRNNFVVIAPSIRHGRPYRWDNHNPITTAPKELIKYLNQKSSKSKKGSNYVNNWQPIGGKTYTGRTLEELLTSSQQGRRNTDMTSFVGKILRHGVDPYMAYELAQIKNEHNAPPLDDGELNTIFNSILKTELERRAVNG